MLWFQMRTLTVTGQIFIQIFIYSNIKCSNTRSLSCLVFKPKSFHLICLFLSIFWITAWSGIMVPVLHNIAPLLSNFVAFTFPSPNELLIVLLRFLRTNSAEMLLMHCKECLCWKSQNTDFKLNVFQGVPYVEGNGMSSLYKLQVKTECWPLSSVQCTIQHLQSYRQ